MSHFKGFKITSKKKAKVFNKFSNTDKAKCFFKKKTNRSNINYVITQQKIFKLIRLLVHAFKILNDRGHQNRYSETFLPQSKNCIKLATFLI